jgi:hypothetical protein
LAFEGLSAVPNYRDEICEILSDGIGIYDTEGFQTVRGMVLHGDGDA